MKGILRTLRSLILWTAALPVFAVCCLLVLIAASVFSGPKLETLIKTCCRLVLLACGIRVRVHGRENHHPGNRYIAVMNHVNFFDPLVFYAGFPGMARGIEEESHFRWPLYGAVLRRIGMIPVNRKDRGKARVSLRRATDLIRNRRDFSFVVLPEGTRTPDGRLMPFKPGAFLLAAGSGLDILPVVQTGARRINRKGSLAIRPGRVDLHIEPPVSVTRFPTDDIQPLMNHVRSIFLHRLETAP
jgi:1-acyl-sn-glycerol-3-phosphate acyltransferase